MAEMNAAVFSTCDFCDTHKADVSGDVRALPAIFKSLGARLAFHGEVATVKCYEDNSAVKAAVESPGRGRILVVDGGGSLRRALLGGNLAAAAARNGWAGVVIDGCARDAAELSVLNMGILALALHPMPTLRTGQGLTDVSVFVQGVPIHPGEWLYADADGLVISARPLHDVS